MDFLGQNEILVQSTLTNFLLAMSLLVCLRVGVFSFGGLACFGIGAYFTAVASIHWGWGAFSSISMAMLISMALGALLAPIVRGLTGLAMGMATIAFTLIAGVAARNGGELTGGAEGLFGIPIMVGTGTALLIATAMTILLALSERGRMGRMIEAVRVDNELSLSTGISVQTVRFVAFVVSGAIGALGGGLAASFRSIVTPLDLGFGPVILALTMLIVGGARSWLGALIGAVFFTWLPTVLTSVGEWQGVVYGVVVAAAAIWVPGGAVGVATDLRRRLAVKRRVRNAIPVKPKKAMVS
ncbi:branched-chain amino acid ABC transporter permease [Dactylosporangium sp. NPDC005572]|uniref:branched-chain amino acid ABC transporter permease n=1 Tax=Dactylosporangium sp. NPDC005572 TaxID=3156889 RepID=UPI0033A1A92E